MKQKQLFPIIRDKVVKMLNNYLKTAEIKNIQTYIIPSMLYNNQALIGYFEIVLTR